jgi:pyridoxine 4-dehydrogenase
LTWRPEPLPDEQCFAAIKAALESGCNYMNGGEFYGPPDNNSLTLLKKYYEKYPEDQGKIVLNIKGCIDLAKHRPDSSPSGVKTSVENSVRQIGGKGRIDQFEPARKDPDTDIETTLAALQEQVNAGNIGGITLSEVSAATIRRAARVAKIEGVEVELSLWSTDPLENGVAQACAELDIPIIAYGKSHFSSSSAAYTYRIKCAC